MTGRSVSDDYIDVDQFELDPETHKITRCPQGYEPTLSIFDSVKKIYTAKFYKEQKEAYHISFTETNVAPMKTC